MKNRQYKYLVNSWERLSKLYTRRKVNEHFWEQIQRKVSKIIEYHNCSKCQGYGTVHQPPFFVVSCEYCKGSGHINK